MEFDNLRICKKCLIRELAEKEDVYASIKRMIDMVEASDKPSDAQYEERLNVCRQCDKLLEGTCTACGCYVELRAARKSTHCPHRKW